jgi:hypothetical protein
MLFPKVSRTSNAGFLATLFEAADALQYVAYDLFDLSHIAVVQVNSQLGKKRFDWRVMRMN